MALTRCNCTPTGTWYSMETMTGRPPKSGRAAQAVAHFKCISWRQQRTAATLSSLIAPETPSGLQGMKRNPHPRQAHTHCFKMTETFTFILVLVNCGKHVSTNIKDIQTIEAVVRVTLGQGLLLLISRNILKSVQHTLNEFKRILDCIRNSTLPHYST